MRFEIYRSQLVSDYELGQALPKDFRSSLPSIEEIEKGLNEWNQE